MASIIDNQRRAFASQAQAAARRLVPAMLNLPEPERAAMLALIAASTATPVDIVLLGVNGDAEACASILDGTLARGDTQTSWKIGSGCCFVVSTLPGEGNPHE